MKFWATLRESPYNGQNFTKFHCKTVEFASRLDLVSLVPLWLLVSFVFFLYLLCKEIWLYAYFSKPSSKNDSEPVFLNITLSVIK